MRDAAGHVREGRAAEGRGEWRCAGPFWLIFRRENGAATPLTLDAAGEAPGKELLPVFGFEEEASLFVTLNNFGADGWRAREVGNGELVSLLFGPCREARRIALDPVPKVGGRYLAGLFTVSREVFAKRLLGRGRPWFYREVFGEEVQHQEVQHQEVQHQEVQHQEVQHQEVQHQEVLPHDDREDRPRRLPNCQRSFEGSRKLVRSVTASVGGETARTFENTAADAPRFPRQA